MKSHANRMTDYQREDKVEELKYVYNKKYKLLRKYK